jgi:hypothetical protein
VDGASREALRGLDRYGDDRAERHLIVEQLLTALLSHHCHTSAALRKADLSFYQQMHLVKAMISPSFPDDCWEWIGLINQLRNDIAHELEPAKLKQHLEKVRAIVEPHRRTAPDEFQSKFDTDEDRVKVLISLCIAYLSTFDSILHLEKKSENVFLEMLRKELTRIGKPNNT